MPILTLLVLIPLASAGASIQRIASEELGPALLSLVEASHGDLVVAAAGKRSEVESAVLLGGKARVFPWPGAVTLDTLATLRSNWGVSCAVAVRHVDDGVELGVDGDCLAGLALAKPSGGPPPTPAPVAAPPPAPAEAAAVAAPVVEPLPARAPASPQQLRDYKRQHLARGTLTQTGTTMMPGGTAGVSYPVVYSTTGWTVYDGGGTPLSPADFALRVGDTSTRRRQQELRKSGVTGLLFGSGAALLGTAMVVRALSQDDDPGNAAAAPGYALLIGGAAGATWGGVRLGRSASVAALYTPTQADSWIDRYNASLREKLDLTEEDVVQIDLD